MNQVTDAARYVFNHSRSMVLATSALAAALLFAAALYLIFYNGDTPPRLADETGDTLNLLEGPRVIATLTTDPNELAKMTTMTLAQAQAKDLPLCSR